MRSVESCILVLLVAVSSASADTIVLKNGRRIVAENVTEDSTHVIYQTSSGQMSIPRSIVARIERDDFGYSAAASASTEPPVSAPQVEPARGYEDIAAHTVHGDSVDYAYIAQLETDARSGDTIAIAKLSAAHHAAARFLVVSKGDTDAAIQQYRQALVFAPENIGLLLNLAVLYLRESQFTAALDPLERARRIAPDSADVAKLTGWAYYGANKMTDAIDAWTRAERLRPDPEVEQALAKAQRDKSEEESYREGETAHFNLKYYGGAAPDLESQLDYTPPDPIAVILYTQQAFADITRAPGWVGALNDGRLRIPVQGLTHVTPELARVLKHELTHSFVGQKSHYRAPTWLQEGIAQWMEGRRSSSSAGSLISAASQGMIPPLETLDGSWMGFSSSDSGLAYAWSLAVAESIIDAGGVSDMSRLIDQVASAPSTEIALKETLHVSYDDLNQQTVAYLKHAYLR
jgi:tetratricopeptide (TPR) repeat protein